MRFKGYENKVLVGEDIAEIEYQPLKCSRPYRLIIVRKNISVQKGEQVLFDEIRYFFYITNRVDYTAEQIVSLANGRCNQENVIEQLKNGVNAMRMPVDDLLRPRGLRALDRSGYQIGSATFRADHLARGHRL